MTIKSFDPELLKNILIHITRSMQPHMPMSHHVVNNLIVKKMSCISILFF